MRKHKLVIGKGLKTGVHRKKIKTSISTKIRTKSTVKKLESSILSLTLDEQLLTQHTDILKQEVMLAAYELVQHGKLSLVPIKLKSQMKTDNFTSQFFRSQKPIVSQPPYHIEISAKENLLALYFLSPEKKLIHSYFISLRPLLRSFKDYQDIIMAYQSGSQTYSAQQLETIDMARRGIHNDAALIWQERLKNKIHLDKETARYFFSLLAVLFIPNAGLMVELSFYGKTKPNSALMKSSQVMVAKIDVTKYHAKKFLFCCTMNSVRSPMALFLARYLGQNKKLGANDWYAAGVNANSEKVVLDPFVPTVLSEKNIPCSSGTGKILGDLDLTEYDMIFALSQEANDFLKKQKLPAGSFIYWDDITDPTLVEGTREQKLTAYRDLRDDLIEKLQHILTQI